MRRLPVAIQYLNFLAKEVKEEGLESNPIRIDAILYGLNMVGEALKKSKVTTLGFPEMSAPSQLSDLRDEFVHKTPKKIFVEEKTNLVISYMLFIDEIKKEPQFSQLSSALVQVSREAPYVDKSNKMQKYFTRLKSRYDAIVTGLRVNNLSDYFDYTQRPPARSWRVEESWLEADVILKECSPSHLLDERPRDCPGKH